jgi:HK97 gp10 family phage protein
MADASAYTCTVRYTNFFSRTDPAFKAEMGAAAKEIGDKAVQIISDNSPVWTGAMQASARRSDIYRSSGAGFYLYVGVGDDTTTNSNGYQYPPFVEFGTMKMEARHFMLDSRDEIAPIFEETVKAHVWNVINTISAAPIVTIINGILQ